MPKTRTLDPRDPTVLRVLLDAGCMQTWECLRQVGGPVSLAVLAQTMERDVVEVGRELDDLVAVELVRKLRARGERRAPTFAVTSEAISMTIEPGTAESRKVVARMAEDSDRRHAQLTANRKPLEMADDADTYFGEVHAVALDADDLRELRRRLGHLAEFLELHARRARRTPDGAVERCNYMVSLQAAPLLRPVLPSPIVGVNAVGTGRSAPHGSHVSALKLSERELHVARELRDGRTRGEIAERLSVSPHTVHTHCKRLFRKLGIERASELHRFTLHSLQERDQASRDATPAVDPEA